MYRSNLKQILEQEPINLLELNYHRYLDFSNAVVMNDANQEYTTTQKGMVFNNGNSSSWQQQFIINDITILGRDCGGSGIIIDELPVSSGVKITKHGYNGYNFGGVLFVPFTDQTIAVPNFSKMAQLTGNTYYVTTNGCLFSAGISSGDVTITYNNIAIPSNEKKFKYLIKDMVITSINNFSGKYFIPIE